MFHWVTVLILAPDYWLYASEVCVVLLNLDFLFGVSIGLATAYSVARYVQSMLYGVAAHDLTTFAGAVVVMIIVVAVAGYLPARRAARIDPLVALRQD